jgi:DNA-binding GntR family transcriptional regulator
MAENNLSSKAYYILEELLVTLKLEPAKIYSEKELMEISCISRTPLREALLRLSNESLLKIIPRRGIEISDINMVDQLAMLETRRVLDTLLIQRATKYATPFEKEKILSLKKQMQDAVGNDEVDGYLRADEELDQTIFKIARNEFAAHATIPLHVKSRRFWYYFKGSEDMYSCSILHTKMIDAIVNGNEEEAVKYSDEIINNLVVVVKDYLQSL